MSTSSTISNTVKVFSRDMLHGYQERAVQFIKDKPFCALWVDMGLGKTVSTLTALAELLRDFTVGKTLIIAPLRVAKKTWPDEIAQWEHTRDLASVGLFGTPKQRAELTNHTADIHVVNRELVEWLVKALGDKWPYDTVIIDESSSFKSPKAKRFRALRKVRPQITRLVELTGTPAPNGYLDLWPQIYLLDQGERLGKTMTAYKNRYFVSDYMGYNWTLKEGAKEEIDAKLADIVLVLEGDDYLELPERVDNTLWLDMPPGANHQYRELEKEFLLEFDDENYIEALNAAALSNKLQQFCNGAVYTNEGAEYSVVHSAKIDALEEIMEASPGKSVLVAYAFRSEKELIQKAFKYAVTVDEPDALERWNRGEIRMLLAHPASAGHGLNIQKGGYTAVWFGLTWSLELYQQFNKRLHRQGQTEPVCIHHIAISGTVEETMLDALGRKGMTQSELMQALKSDIEARAA